MLTDPVYEGKSMAGLIEYVPLRRDPGRIEVLDRHLGGQPGPSAYASTPGLG